MRFGDEYGYTSDVRCHTQKLVIATKKNKVIGFGNEVNAIAIGALSPLKDKVLIRLAMVVEVLSSRS
jgi:hypothetical protein